MEHGQDGLNCAAYNQNQQSNKVCLAPSLQIRCDRHLSECNNWSSPVFTSILQLENVRTSAHRGTSNCVAEDEDKG